MNEPNSVGRIILLVAEQVLAITAIAVFVNIFFQPFIDQYFQRSQDRAQADTDRRILNSLRRQGAEVKDWMLMSLFKDRVERVDRAMFIAEANVDRLTALREIADGHGSELRQIKHDMKDMPRVVEALERIDAAVEKMAKIQEDTRDEVMQMRGMWDGKERRSHER